jgi:DHA2 family multidrug resistance protein
MSAVASTLDLPAARPAPETAELKGVVLVAVITILAVGNFLAVLDLTITNVLVPHIAGALGASPSDGTWVITGYGMAEAITVPLTGWLAARFGPEKVFALCLAGFGIFSVLCGLSPSLDILIFFRIVLGVCGGPLIPLSQALILKLVPQRHVNVAMIAWAMTSIIAPISGPVLGGLIGDNWGWQWAFYFKVPLTFVVAFFAWRILIPHGAPAAKAAIDYVGLLLLICWVGALQVMLGNGQDDDWFSSGFIVILFIMAAVCFIAFVIWELTDDAPIVDLRIFRNRAFSVSMVVVALAYGVVFGTIVLIPLWLQTSMGYTSTLAGYNSAFMGISSVFTAPVASLLMKRLDHRLIISIGLMAGTGTCMLYVGYDDQISFWQMVWPQLLLGFAAVMVMIPLIDMSVSSLPPADIAAAAGQFSFIRTLASALSAAAVVAYWNDRIRNDGAVLASNLQGPQALLNGAAAHGVGQHQALSLLDLMVQRQSVMLATNDTFLILAAMMAASAAIVWIAPKPPKSTGSMPIGH